MPAETAGRETIDGLTRVLARACRHLAHAGQPEEAGRLAADAWTLLRHTHPVQAQRLDGTMHHVALLETQPEATPLPDREEPTMPVTDRIVDVRTEIPRIRHQLIFDTFASLDAGTGFVLVNDHDPKPLYYQLAAENAGEFSGTTSRRVQRSGGCGSAGLLRREPEHWPPNGACLERRNR